MSEAARRSSSEGRTDLGDTFLMVHKRLKLVAEMMSKMRWDGQWQEKQLLLQNVVTFLVTFLGYLGNRCMWLSSRKVTRGNKTWKSAYLYFSCDWEIGKYVTTFQIRSKCILAPSMPVLPEHLLQLGQQRESANSLCGAGSACLMSADDQKVLVYMDVNTK